DIRPVLTMLALYVFHLHLQVYQASERDTKPWTCFVPWARCTPTIDNTCVCNNNPDMLLPSSAAHYKLLTRLAAAPRVLEVHKYMQALAHEANHLARCTKCIILH